MGSQTLSILRQGVWASLTGGWYYDPRQSHASNIFHLYIWLLLLLLPIGTQLIINNNSKVTTNTATGTLTGNQNNSSIVLWIVYCFIVALVFITIKLINWYLHQVFDKGECVFEDNSGDANEVPGEEVPLEVNILVTSENDDEFVHIEPQPGPSHADVQNNFSNNTNSTNRWPSIRCTSRTSHDSAVESTSSSSSSSSRTSPVSGDTISGVRFNSDHSVYQSANTGLGPLAMKASSTVDMPKATVVIASPTEPTETSVIVHHEECSTSRKSIETTSSIHPVSTADQGPVSGSKSLVETEDSVAMIQTVNSTPEGEAIELSIESNYIQVFTDPDRDSRTGFSLSPSHNLRMREFRDIDLPAFRLLQDPSFPTAYLDIHSNEISTSKRKQYYKLWLPPKLNWTYVKLHLDRLQLLALLDNNLTNFELFASIALAVIVAILGSTIIHLNIFKDITFYIFAFVISSCQYTLLKSVQPDAASPTHGYNRTIIFSRPIYFTIVSIIIVSCHFILIGRLGTFTTNQYGQWTVIPLVNPAASTSMSSTNTSNHLHFTLYGVDLFSTSIIQVIYSTSKIFILSFPIIFSFGLLPQIDTFLIYLLEQIEIHVFGGTAATTGLTSAIFAFTRSLLVIILLYILALLSLHRVYFQTKNMRGDFTYNSYDVAFSVFCGIMVAFAYLLSRSSSDPTVLTRLVKRFSSWIHRSCNFWFQSLSAKSASINKSHQLMKQRSKKPQPEEVEMNPVNGSGNNLNNQLNQQNQSQQQQQQHSQPQQPQQPQQQQQLQQQQQQQQPPHHQQQQQSKQSTLTSTNEENVADDDDSRSQEYQDPLPGLLEDTLCTRLQNDLIICVLVTIVVFATHVSTIFTLQPTVELALGILAFTWGLILHYFLKHSRKQLPWLCFSSPFLKSKEYDLFEVKDEASLMCFEYLYCWLHLIEKNAIYPLFFLSAVTKDTPILLSEFGFELGTLISVLCTFKAIRSTLNDSSYNYIILVFTYLFSEFDLKSIREAFILNYFVGCIVFCKIYDLLLKFKFVITYVAPWQITWGSAFHAFAQPFSVPHSGMLMIQAIISAILSSPLQPILGSAIFLTSYVRPIKFWERDYNTKRVDASNIRLASQLERSQLGNDDNNLNSIFYEHLTRSLQTSLYGDLMLGRWGQVSQGDCFILASENLNCLVHIIELGNGLVTFQVRGLEFRGTYCQQREVEALSEDVSEDEGCCCCEPGHLPHMLSINAAFNLRWLAWEVTHTKYVLEGYSISDNSAVSFLQAYELRKALISYYVKSVIFYTIINKRLDNWIGNQAIIDSLSNLASEDFVDLDPTFNPSVDEDFDTRSAGITRGSFCKIYSEWIQFCLRNRPYSVNNRQSATSQLVKQGASNLHSLSHHSYSSQASKEAHPENELDLQKVTTLCFALSLIARRALSAASHNNSITSVEFLLFGLHALFKGDLRITSPRDEWVFQDMELLKQVIAPSVRMAVKLHHDHIATEDYDDSAFLYGSIMSYEKNIVISHEADPVWRNAVLSNVPSLLALRHVFDEGTDRYKFVMLNKRYLSFRVIKVNKECVRGLWAGQQQELIYLRNRNPERGSIQNAKQALRNIINSSCDQPIGYPIYVSPLTTSFAETSNQLCRVIGNPFTFSMFKIAAVRVWTRTKVRFGQGCSGDITTGAGAATGGPASGSGIVLRGEINSSSSLQRPTCSMYVFDHMPHHVSGKSGKEARSTGKLETRRIASRAGSSASTSHLRHTSQGTPILLPGSSRQWQDYTVRSKSGSSRGSRRRNSSSSNSSTLVNVTTNVTANATEMPLLASSSVTEESGDRGSGFHVFREGVIATGSSDDSLCPSGTTASVRTRFPSRASRDTMSQV